MSEDKAADRWAVVSLASAARIAWLGAVLGLVLGAIGELVFSLRVASGGFQPGIAERIVACLLLAASFGLVFGLLSSLVLLVRRGRIDRPALVAIAAFGTLIVWVHSFGVAISYLTGSHLTLTGLQYFLNSGTHIAREMVLRFAPHLAAVAIGAGLVGYGLARLFAFACQRSRVGFPRIEAGVFVFLVLASSVYWLVPVPRAFALGVTQSVPEFAFAVSLRPPPPPSIDLSAEDKALIGAALASPPIEAGAMWKAAAPGLGKRPNIILITVEAINIHHLGYEGYKRNASPSLDKLVKTSLVAKRAYTTATHSNYAQPAILSSLFPRRGSELDMYQRLDYPRFLLHDATTTIGYSAATISSQDENWQGMRLFQNTGAPVYYHDSNDFRGEHLDIGTEDVVPDELTMDSVLVWIDEQKKKDPQKPLSIYINLQATHFPYSVPPKGPHPFEPYEPKGTFNYVEYAKDELPTVVNKYDNALHYIDAQVGKLMDGLEARGLSDDTLVVFVADHGEMFWDHQLVTHARSLYEPEARVPMIFHYPKGITPGLVQTPVSEIDVMPTILDAIGLPPHPSMQGQSILPLRVTDDIDIEKASPKHPAVFLNIQGWVHLDAIVCWPYKAIYDPESETSTLYDVAADPGESHDLAKEMPAISRTLISTLHAQVNAQLAYYNGEAHLSGIEYAPRMLPCPALPAPGSAASGTSGSAAPSAVSPSSTHAP